MTCPRCSNRTRITTTVEAWDHIAKSHREWMRELIRMDDADIKIQLREAFPGIVG